jgi:dTDP-4-dehydrorhamnose 3,5-epimerase
MTATIPKKDQQTVTVDGQPMTRLIEGVIVKSAVTHIDDRGTLCEIHTPHAAPLISQGQVKVVPYDSRPDSPTFGLVNEIYRTDLDRNLMVIPAFVFHAHRNIGTTDALFVSMPTRAYQHDDPDVYRLPIDSDEVPYRFDNRQGW